MEQQTDTQTAENTDAAVFGIVEESSKNLPMVLETQGDLDLVSRENMSPSDIEQAKQIAQNHDITNTSSNLYYGAAAQKEINTVLDQLLEGVKTKESGLAGVLATELNDSIDLLKLDETKKQIISGQGFFAKYFSAVIKFFGGIANYIEYLISMQQPIKEKFDGLENKYNNRIQTLSNNSRKLDMLIEATVNQIQSLAINIIAGEEILIAAKAKYKQMAEEAVQSRDTLKLQQVRDFGGQIAIFDTRFVQLKHAYVEASAITIPRVRRSQEAITIEIEGIVRGILFVIPKLKASVVELLALYDTKAAQNDRQALDEVERKLSQHTSDILNEVVNTAKQSQGLALQRAQDLEQVVRQTIEAIKADRENEKQSEQNRREAEKLLIKLKTEVDITINDANLDAAIEATK